MSSILIILLESTPNPFLMLIGIIACTVTLIAMVCFYGRLLYYLIKGILYLIFLPFRGIYHYMLNKKQRKCDEIRKKYPLAYKKICEQFNVSKSYEPTWSEANRLLKVKTFIWESDEKTCQEFEQKKKAEAKKSQDIRLFNSKGYAAWCDEIGQKYPSNSLILANKNRIEQLNKYILLSNSYSDWISEQEKYSNDCIDCANEILPEFGRYVYYVDIPGINKNGDSCFYSMKVWEFFPYAVCFEDDVDYKYYPSVRNNIPLISRLGRCETQLEGSIYDKIVNYIAFQSFAEEELVLLNDAIEGWDDNAYHYQYDYIISKFDEAGVEYHFISEIDNGIDLRDKRKVVIVDMFTKNDNLKSICKHITVAFSTCHPLICYITLFKCYDSKEITKIISDKVKKLDEQKKEEEKIRIEEAKKEKKHKELQYLFSVNTYNWFEPSRSNLKYFSLYNYYPTTCEWEADEEDWDVRNLIWNFKANPHKQELPVVTNAKHSQAVAEIVPSMTKCLKAFFANNLSEITIVCIPSSKAAVTQRRYEDFSAAICNATGMSNGYNYVHVTSDGEAKHTGGSVVSQYSLDDSFFKDKFVLIFDDVITSGDSMDRMRRKLESCGASVIGGFSIGRTKHEKLSFNPIDQLNNYLNIPSSSSHSNNAYSDDLPF